MFCIGAAVVMGIAFAVVLLRARRARSGEMGFRFAGDARM